MPGIFRMGGTGFFVIFVKPGWAALYGLYGVYELEAGAAMPKALMVGDCDTACEGDVRGSGERVGVVAELGGPGTGLSNAGGGAGKALESFARDEGVLILLDMDMVLSMLPPVLPDKGMNGEEEE